MAAVYYVVKTDLFLYDQNFINIHYLLQLLAEASSCFSWSRRRLIVLHIIIVKRTCISTLSMHFVDAMKNTSSIYVK